MINCKNILLLLWSFKFPSQTEICDRLIYVN